MTFAIAFTGHRPESLGGYGEHNPIRDALKVQLTEVLSLHKAAHPDLLCISGMAQGFDQWAAEICIELNIPFTAAVPFAGQEARWSVSSQADYLKLLEKALNVHIVSEGDYAAWKLQRRNEWMVDHCDLLIAAWDGKLSGGTWNTIAYAQRRNRRIANLLPNKD